MKRWHTMHGVALNVDPPMEYFRHIVPCGIADRPVAALADFVPGAWLGLGFGVERTCID